MAKIIFKEKTSKVISDKYVKKETFRKLLLILICLSALLGMCLCRMYFSGDFSRILSQITTYYDYLIILSKGLF